MINSSHWSLAALRAMAPLMRTAPVALAYLDDEAALVEAARAVSELRHFDPDAGDACVLSCLAIRHAILTGQLDVRIGLRHIDADRRTKWAALLDAAEKSRPADFPTTVGWSKRYRPPGRPSRPRPSPPTTQQQACSGPIICA
jgi:ADP-ribosyl-[dinitrogen reductase] hydrolase